MIASPPITIHQQILLYFISINNNYYSNLLFPNLIQHFNSQNYGTWDRGPTGADFCAIVDQLLSRSLKTVRRTSVSSGSHKIPTVDVPPLTSKTNVVHYTASAIRPIDLNIPVSTTRSNAKISRLVAPHTCVIFELSTARNCDDVILDYKTLRRVSPSRLFYTVFDHCEYKTYNIGFWAGVHKHYI